MQLNTIEKSNAIRDGVLYIAHSLNGHAEIAQSAAIHMLCDTCALLTSAVKAEREDGKQRVRAWRAAQVSHAKP